MPDRQATVAFVPSPDALEDVAAAACLRLEDVDEVITGTGEDAVDALQDAVYGRGAALVLLASLEQLGPDLMTQETVLAGWAERGVKVYSRAEPDLGAGDPERESVRGVVGSIDEYGKIPWIP